MIKTLPQALSRRRFLSGSLATAACAATGWKASRLPKRKPALIAITLDLEMSGHYPKRGMLEWNYRKGDLDDATKQYSVKAGKIVKQAGGVLHYFCVGRVLEHASVDWLKEIAADGHPIGNHTYDHVNVRARKPEETQHRFRRSPWLVRGMSAADIIRENIRTTSIALKERAGIQENGFRTPGGFANGLADRPDVQQMLLDLGFKWVSGKYPQHKTGEPKQEPSAEVYTDIVRAQQEAQPFVYESGLIEIPMSPISDVTGFRTNFWKRDWFLKATRLSVERAIETGGVFDFLAHPSCLVVEDPQFEIIQMICDVVKGAGDRAKIVGLDAIAGRVRESM